MASSQSKINIHISLSDFSTDLAEVSDQLKSLGVARLCRNVGPLPFLPKRRTA